MRTMFKLTKDAIYLLIIMLLILIMTLEFHRFVNHYIYLESILHLIYQFKHEPKNIDLVFNFLL